MASVKKIVVELAKQINISCEKSKKIAYGVHRGYTIFIWGDTYSSIHRVRVSLCAGSYKEAPNLSLIQTAISRDVKLTADKYRLTLSSEIRGNDEENITRIANDLQGLINILLENSWINCDEEGVIGTTSVYKLKGRYAFLNEATSEILQKDIEKAAYSASQTHEKYGAGILGALLGSAGGSLLIFLIARLGFVSTLSSGVFGFAIVLCYKKFAGKLSKISSVLCILISTASTYLTFRIDAALSLYKALVEEKFTVTYAYCFKNTKELYELARASAIYTRNCMLIMLAGIVGTIIAVCMLYSSQEEEFEIHRLGQ